MIYLDNAATSFPKPPEVYEALDRCMRELGANPGRAAYRMAVSARQMIDDARRILAQLLGAPDPTRIVFTLNATDSLNIAIKGILESAFPNPQSEIRNRQSTIPHVVTTLIEHNSVSRPLNRLEAEGRISVTRLAPDANGILSPEEVRDALRPETCLVALTHCSNVLGAIQPIAATGEILRSHPAAFLVDAAQTAGCVPIDVEAMGIDLLAFPGHKALMGPPGTGGLYVREGIDLAPWREGGTGEDSATPLHPDAMPYRLEGGTPNTTGIGALAAGVRTILEIGVDQIHQHEQALIARIIEALRDDNRFELYGPTDATNRAGVLAFNIRGIDPQEAAMIFDQSFDIAVRAGLHCAPDAHRLIGTFPDGAVRVSPGLYNTDAEIDTLIAALREIAASATTT